MRRLGDPELPWKHALTTGGVEFHRPVGSVASRWGSVVDVIQDGVFDAEGAYAAFEAGTLPDRPVLLSTVVDGVLDEGAMLVSIDGAVYRRGKRVFVLLISAELKAKVKELTAANGGPLGEASALGTVIGTAGVVVLDASGMPKANSSTTAPLVEVTALRFGDQIVQ